MPDPRRITVSVIYAEPGRAFSVEIALPENSTVADAIEASCIRAAIPGIEIPDGHVGIFARKVSPDTVVRDGDRVEIYRPLEIDPKEARRKRARAR